MTKPHYLSVLLSLMSMIICISPTIAQGQVPGKIKIGAGEQSSEQLQKDTKPFVLHRTNNMEWDPENRVLSATGDVHAESKNRDIYADRVEYHETSNRVIVKGNARIVDETQGVVTGDYFEIQRSTGELKSKSTSGQFSPWFFDARRIEGSTDTYVEVESGSLTTCNLSSPHYDITASTFYFYPGDRLIAYNARFRFGQLPVFYWPYLSIDLSGKKSRWEFKPGLNDRDGAIMGINYHYLMNRDQKPVTGTIYTDSREKNSSALGLDVKWDGNSGRAYGRYMQARRGPLKVEDGSTVRDTDQVNQFTFDSEVNVSIPSSNWNIQSDVDWASHNRFQRDLIQSFGSRSQSERQANGSLVWTGDNSRFRLEGEVEDRVTDSSAPDSFVQRQKVFPRARYELFSVPVPWLGRSTTYRFSSQVQKTLGSNLNDRFWDGFAEQSLTHSRAWNAGFSQSYRFQYRHEYNEVRADEFNSISSGEFELQNSMRLSPSLDFDVDWTISPQLNDRDQVSLNLNGQNLGQEQAGLREHGLDFTWRWSGQRSFMFLESGIDLRQLEDGTIDADSRVRSPRLNSNLQLSHRWTWNQLLRWDWQDQQLSQLNSRLVFDQGDRFSGSVGWNFNQRTGDNLSQVTHGFNWRSPDDEWRLRGDFIYDIPAEEMDQTSLKLFKRLHMWEMQLSFSEVRTEDAKVHIQFNLRQFPDRILGFEQSFED